MSDIQRAAERYRDERDALCKRLTEQELPGLPPSVTDAVFEKAWDDGHASGEHEIEMHYVEIAAIAMNAWEAGRKHEIDRPQS